ncbi:hypothetical protein [Deinococcus pimensis]|uniref:hypothetical protein n=1 Tax=Deinococcus pimensis TaxID=309888 RepID=UPI00048A2552|nr:hypothetical protein [Deinococcus pimensis]
MYDEIAELNKHWRTDVAGPHHHAELQAYDKLGLHFTWSHDEHGLLRFTATDAAGTSLATVTAWPRARHAMMLTLVLNDLVATSLPYSA